MPHENNLNVLRPDIPSVGGGFELWHAYPTVIGRCKCESGGVINLIVMTQLNNITVCKKCGYGYQIVGIGPQGPVIGVVVPAHGTHQ